MMKRADPSPRPAPCTTNRSRYSSRKRRPMLQIAVSDPNGTDGILARQRRLCSYLHSAAFGPEVVEDLLADGEPFEFETALWDYKLELPDFTLDLTGEPGLGRLIKVVASLYNSFGGYILAGVEDNPREIVGYMGNFNCDAFNNIVFKYLKTPVRCLFKTHSFHTSRSVVSLGLLYVPPRPPDIPPAEFRKTYTTRDGDTAFRAGQIYLRQSHESVPAVTSADFQFLMNPQRLQLPSASSFQRDFLLDHNIPPRDGDLYEFVGRHNEIDELWRWFSDRFSPVRILTGMGGVGKTTIARVFAEQIVEQPPSGLEKIIWLSAKKSFFVPTANTTRPTLKVDFVDKRSMLMGILNELGGPSEYLSEDVDLEELIDETVTALDLFPSLVVVDDVDSLVADEQYEIFHVLLTIISRCRNSKVSSRALLTSRLDLGAGSSRLIRVRGFPLKEFYHYVRVASESFEINLGLERESPLMRRFHKVTQGSPMFALSVLRLVNLGEL
jgi:hypothetical protein